MAGPGVISLTRTERYSSLVAEEQSDLRDARIFSDFEICIKEESIPCHRFVLSVHSAMMKAMLTSEMAEAAKHSVKLDHIDLGVMKVILDYMYVGQVSLHTDQLSDMIIACDYLRINLLKDMCVDQVPAILQPTNAIQWLKLSHKLDLFDVKSQCLEIIGASFTTISRQLEFVDLSLVNVQECLNHVQQSSQQQDGALIAAMKWVDRDSTERMNHLETLVNQVHLDQCSPKGILGVMRNYKSMITATETLYDRLTAAAMENLSSKAKTPCKPTLTIIGGQIDEEVSGVWWKLNENNQVEEMLRIPFDDLQCRHSVCKTPVGFIISGGHGSTLCIIFNVETKKWSRLQDMMKNRHRHGSVSIRGVLYVLGGKVDGIISKSVHSLMIEDGNWQEESDLPNALRWPKVAELDDSVYLLDEETGQLFQMDVDQKKWCAKASLPRRTYHGVNMASFNGRLYVAGEGEFAWYIPATDTWVQGRRPNKKHSYGSLAPYNTKLLLLGGSYIGGTDEVEEVNVKDETWSVSTWKMPAPLFNHHALVLDIPEEV